MENFNKLDFRRIIKLLIRDKSIFLFNLIVISILLLVISLVIPEKFSSYALILPPEDIIDPLTYGYSGIGEAATSSFKSALMGTNTTSEVWANVLKSRRVLRQVIQELDLFNKWETKYIEDTYEILSNMISIIITPEGIITISVINEDKYLARDIVNELIINLDKVNQELIQNTATNKVIFLEKRLFQVKDSLHSIEQYMSDYNIEHGIINLELETEPIIEALSSLKAQEIIVEAELAGYRTEQTIIHPQRRSAEAKLAFIREKINQIERAGGEGLGLGFSVPLESIPEISILYTRVKRDYIIQNTLYELLVQEYERAKINEQRNLSTLKIIDYPEIAQKKSWPRRSVFIFLGIILGFSIGFILVIIKDKLLLEIDKGTYNDFFSY